MKLFLFDVNAFNPTTRPTLPNWCKQAHIAGHALGLVGNLYSVEQVGAVVRSLAPYGIQRYAFGDGVNFAVLPSPATLNWVIGGNQYEEVVFITDNFAHFPAGVSVGATCIHANEFFSRREEFLREEQDVE